MLRRQRHGRVAPQVPLTVIVLLLAVLGVFIWWKDDRGDPDHLTVSGSVEGESVRIGSKLGGRLRDVTVIEGDAVTAGQVVAHFDAPEIEAQRQQLIAAKAQAQAVLEKLHNGPRSVDLNQAAAGVATAKANYAEVAAGARNEDIAAAKAQWQAAEVQYKLAVADLDRAHKLFEQDVIPRSQLDAAQARVDDLRHGADAAKEQYEKAQRGPRDTQLAIAAAQIRAAQASYNVIKAGSRPEDVKAAQASIAGIDAQLAQLDANFAETIVKVPSAGVVTDLLAQPGDLVLPDSPIIEMLRDGSYYIQIFIPEAKHSWAQPGTQAQIKLDTYPGEAFTGHVTFLATQGEFTPRNLQTKEKRVEEVYRCKVKIDDTQHKLRPGMVCDVVFSKPGQGSAR